MPGLVLGVHVLDHARRCADGRDEPGHDNGKTWSSSGYALKIVSPNISSTRKITTKT